jgi:hypothetical protein
MPLSTDVGGAITTDTIWTLAGSPYIVTSDVTVQSGVMLTVEAGVEVRFNNGTGLFVHGAVHVAGTASQPITFTTSSTTPAPGQWEGIFFEEDSDNARNLLEYATVSYAGQRVCWWHDLCGYTGIGVYDAAPTICYTTVRQSAGHGLWASNANLTLGQDTFEQNAGGSGVAIENTTLTLSNSTLRQNGAHGLAVSANSVVLTPTLTGNTFSNNTQHAVYVQYTDGAGLPVVSGNIATGNVGFNGVAVAGTLGYAMTVPSAYDLPLGVAGGDLTINNGVELTVQSGAPMLFSGTALYVNGALRAVGTMTQPITFTTSASSPAAGQWKGIYIEPDSDDARTVLEYVTVSYAGQGYAGYWHGCWYCRFGIGVWEASPTIRRTTVQYSAGYGLYAYGMNSEVSQNIFEQNNGDGVFVVNTALLLRESAVRQNGGHGIVIGANDVAVMPTLSGNTIENNSGHAVYVQYNNGAGLPIISGNSVSGNSGFSGVAMAGIIGQTMTWPATYALPLRVAADVTVLNGVELTVEPGVEVSFNSGSGLMVNGALRAVGTATQPITFTTSAPSPAAGQWKGIYIEADSDDARMVLEYVTVSYAGQGFGGWWHGCWYCRFGIGVWEAAPTIRHTTVHHSAGYGLWAGNTTLPLAKDTFEQNASDGVSIVNTTLTLTDSTLRLNNRTGLQVQSGSARVEGCSIVGNSNFGIENMSPGSTVRATYNWWGHPSGPYHAATNPGGQGNAVSDKGCGKK